MKIEFEVAYQENERRVFGYLYHRLGNAWIAEDLTSQTFLRAFRAYDRYNPTTAPIGNWFGKIAHNLLINHSRKGQNLSLDSIPKGAQDHHTPDTFADLIEDPKQNPLEEVLRNSMAQEIRRAVEQLPPHYRYVVVGHYLEEKSYRELALELDSNVGVVKSRVHRGVVMLRRDLQDIA